MQDFNLHVVLRIVDADAIVLRKALQQVDALMHQAIPSLAFLVFERCITVSTPFREQCGARVFPAEESAQGFFKGTSKNHGSSSFLFSPAIQITISVATWTSQVLADLREAIDHHLLLAH